MHTNKNILSYNAMFDIPNVNFIDSWLSYKLDLQ